MNNIKVKCEVIQDFFLEAFREITIIKRKSIDLKGKLFVGDIIECSKEMADYLSGNNDYEEKVVKIIEVEPEKKYSFVIAEKLDDENITPLSTKEELDKLGDKIKEYVVTKPKKNKKAKSSKK